jgi:hypothetical protein
MTGHSAILHGDRAAIADDITGADVRIEFAE